MERNQSDNRAARSTSEGWPTQVVGSNDNTAIELYTHHRGSGHSGR